MRFKILASLLILTMLTSFTFAQEKAADTDENKEKIMKTCDLIQSLVQPLAEYANKNPFGLYPETSEEEDGNGTVTLVKELSEGNFYQFDADNLTKEKPYQLVDAWGNVMRYHDWHGRKVQKDKAHNKKGYDLWSAGPDGVFDTGDEIANFEVIQDPIKDIQKQVLSDSEAIKKMFEDYFKAINAYEVEKSIEFYYVPEDKMEEFKKNLTEQMDAMKKMYGDHEFVRNFEVKSAKFQGKTAELTYSSEFYIVDSKEWSKSDNTLKLVKIDGKWKIDIYEVFKVESSDEMWAEARTALGKIVAAVELFRNNNGNLDVLSTDVWKPVSHIMGAIKLDSDVLNNLRYFDLEDFNYITRKIEGVVYYRVICVAWGGKTGGKSTDGPGVGTLMYDSEKHEYTEDFECTKFDGLGKADVKKAEDPEEKTEKPKIDEETKTEISQLIDGFLKSINSFDAKNMQEFVYITDDYREQVLKTLVKILETIKEGITEENGAYVKDWMISNLVVEGTEATVSLKFYAFLDGEWKPKEDTYFLIKVNGKWLVNLFGLKPQKDDTQTNPDEKEDVKPEDPANAKINALIDEYFKSFNALDADRIFACIYVPEGKKDEAKKQIKFALEDIEGMKIPEKYSLFNEWIVTNIEIKGEKAYVDVEYGVFQDEEHGYYEDNMQFIVIKTDGKWLVDMYMYSDGDINEEEWLREELSKLQKENEALKAKIKKLQNQNKNLRKNNKDLRAKNKKLQNQNKKSNSDKTDGKESEKPEKKEKKQKKAECED